MQAPPINEDQLQLVLDWVDSFSFSRPKKNLNRDFSDGVLVAQIMKSKFPQWVQLHNYSSGNSSSAKYINWKTLNEKVFKKLNFNIHKNDIENLISVVPGTIQKVLYLIYSKVSKYQSEKNLQNQENADKILNQKVASKQVSLHINVAKQLSSQLIQKDQIIKELRDTVLILEQKLKKMDQLNKLKDSKIENLVRKMQQTL